MERSIFGKPEDAGRKSRKRTRNIARSYLAARYHREDIEFDQSKADASPTRLVEIIIGKRLASRLGLKFETRKELDEELPDIAENVVNRTAGTIRENQE